jgi:hypothetical protein
VALAFANNHVCWRSIVGYVSHDTGIHYVTIMAGDPTTNAHFYVGTLGGE